MTPPPANWPVIWIDFDDVLVHLDARSRPSGIQRLAFEVARQMHALAGPQRVRFLRHAQHGAQLGAQLGNGFREVSFDTIARVFTTATGQHDTKGQQATAPAPAPATPDALRAAWRRIGNWLPTEIHRALTPLLRGLWAAAAALPGVVRAIGRAVVRRRIEARDVGHDGPVRMAPGDVLFALAAPWGREHTERARTACADHGVRYAALIYDMIPICRPEFCDPQHGQRFRDWIDAMLPLCDVPMAISQSARHDVDEYVRAQGIALRAPVAVITIGSGFSDAPPPDTPLSGAPLSGTPLSGENVAPVLPPGSYVLFVSTIDARKNHTLLFRVWRRLIDTMPKGSVPTLVFAGSLGWMVDDLMQQIRNSRFLDGHLVIVESPTDAVLAGLYRGAMFSVFPSHYEGWGLPVVESHVFGTPVVAANATSLPEAGGTLARYFEADNPADATRVIRALIENPAELTQWRAEVRANFRPVSWQRTAAEILDALALPPTAKPATAKPTTAKPTTAKPTTAKMDVGQHPV